MSGKRSAVNRRSQRRRTSATPLFKDGRIAGAHRANLRAHKSQRARTHRRAVGTHESLILTIVKGEKRIACTEEVFLLCMVGAVRVRTSDGSTILRESETMIAKDKEGFRIGPLAASAGQLSEVLVVMVPTCSEFP